eukprot:9198280-Lingulodinium_polyedra.AAC.1
MTTQSEAILAQTSGDIESILHEMASSWSGGQLLAALRPVVKTTMGSGSALWTMSGMPGAALPRR